MRTTLLIAAIAASLGFAACSSGGPQAVPAGSQPQMEPGFSARLILGGLPPAGCPTKYIGCVTVAKGHPAKYTICVSNTGNCNSGSFPKEKWSSKVVTLAGKLFKGIVGTFKPNPGNPTTATLTAKVNLKNSKGKVDYVQNVKACPPSGGSCVTGKIGIKTK